MDWTHKLQALRWRALEESDVSGALLPQAQRMEATRHALIEAGEQAETFITSRAAWLESQVEHQPGSALHGILAGLRVPAAGGWAWAGWGLALVAGYALTELGHAGLMNLLAVPLLGLIVWNVIMIVLSLIAEWRASPRRPQMPGWAAWLLRRWQSGRDETPEDKTGPRFRQLVQPMLWLRLGSRAVAWLHIGAAIFATGTIVGMYAKGWSKEYRAVWESTVLDERGARGFLSAIYGPASKVFHQPLPLEGFAAMRTGPGRPDPVPGPALPWIHLYAGTLFLLVLLPRLGLAALTLWRGGQRVEQAWRGLGWAAVQQRLKAEISGGGERLSVLCHGWRLGEEPRERWAAVLRGAIGQLIRLDYSNVPAGDEDAFMLEWRPDPAVATLVAVFNAAATPEPEIHTTLVSAVREQLTQTGVPKVRFIAMLDTQSLDERWPRSSADERLKLWRAALLPWVDEVVTTRTES